MMIAILVLLFFIAAGQFDAEIVYADEAEYIEGVDSEIIIDNQDEIVEVAAEPEVVVEAAEVETEAEVKAEVAEVAAEAEMPVAATTESVVETEVLAEAAEVAEEVTAEEPAADEVTTEVTEEVVEETVDEVTTVGVTTEVVTTTEEVVEEPTAEEPAEPTAEEPATDEPAVVTDIQPAMSDEIIIDSLITDSNETVTVSSFDALGDRNYEMSVDRLSGYNRYETSLEIAEALKSELGVSTFDNVVIATGEAYPDALSGAYFAKTKSAPIILISDATSEKILDYVRENLSWDGGVYILGGDSAVSAKVETALNNISNNVKRLAGADRYGTNLAILEELDARYMDEMAVVSGRSYADALSASGVRLPLLLVGNRFNAAQEEFLNNGVYKDFYIIGGPAAVNEDVAWELDYYWGDIYRVAGEDRFETSVAVAKEFFSNFESEVLLTNGNNFPDGVSGGALAQIKEVPLILSSNDAAIRIRDYLLSVGTELITALGGEQALQTEAITTIPEGEEPRPINPISIEDGELLHGIDVSVFNGHIDWDLVANDGIDFAIVRVGGRFGATGLLYDDIYARQNLAGAQSAGLMVGAYYFTQAVSEAEAIQEANYIINAVKGFNMTLPLVIDTEYLGDSRHDYLPASQRTSVVRAFCDRIREAGYEAMIYASRDWLENELYMDELDDIPVWVAEWAPTCNYEGDYAMWQYTDSGWVDGIDGYVDMNFLYGGRL